MNQPSFWSRLFQWPRQPVAPAATAGTGPAQGALTAPSGTGGTSKSVAMRLQRHARREKLIALVRENMIRSGVLSASYKFKVLTLEPTGQQFIVMFDIQPGQSMASDPASLAMLESSLQSLAKERLGVEVRHAYWRHVAPVASAGLNPSATAPAPVARAFDATTAPAAVKNPTVTQPAVQQPATASPTAPRRSGPSIDDVSDEEMKALRAALASAQAQAPGKAPARGLPDGWHERDFEPTASMDETPQTDFSALSETQYGQLR